MEQAAIPPQRPTHKRTALRRRVRSLTTRWADTIAHFIHVSVVASHLSITCGGRLPAGNSCQELLSTCSVSLTGFVRGMCGWNKVHPKINKKCTIWASSDALTRATLLLVPDWGICLSNFLTTEKRTATTRQQPGTTEGNNP